MMSTQRFPNSSPPNDVIFTFARLDEFVEKVASLPLKTVKNNKKIEYINYPCAFDIETTSTYINDEKVAFMYVWQLAIGELIIIGRTWEEWLHTYELLSFALATSLNKRLVIYVHNLAYEFQFLCHYHEWKKVFAVDKRKPVHALSMEGIEFRCSYLLSGYSLEKLSSQLLHHEVTKKVGFLDYEKIRHSKTLLTAEELEYIISDVQVVVAYIAEKIELDGDISKIPYTKTSYVRNRCRRACFRDKYAQKFTNYRKLMNSLTLTADEYKQLKRAFQGGFTHACWGKVCKVFNDVCSFDLGSSYPTVMLAEQFPMSAARMVRPTMQEFNYYLKNYCCLFNIKLYNVRPRLWFENPISESKCEIIGNRTINNGRVMYADVLITTVTEQDFFIYQKFYDWEKFEISEMRVYEKGYLPTDLIKVIVELYKAKTELKGVDGKEYEYMMAKADINSVYGMTVTDICRDEQVFDGVWSTQPADIEEAIKKNNTSVKRFLFYPWGVWVTAYARRNLFSAIHELKEDYIYSDTDSVKFQNFENHTKYFEVYNKMIGEKIRRACEYHGIDFADTHPKTVKGVEKPLGVWEQEPTYTRFKTLGAKRYMVEVDGVVSITVAGVNKKTAVPFLMNNFADPFTAFNDDLYIPAEFTGKKTHTYIDQPQEGYIIDYLGNEGYFREMSSVHLSGADYSLSLSREFRDLLKSKGII